MGLFTKNQVAASSATKEAFVLGSTVQELNAQRLELEAAMTAAAHGQLPKDQKAMFKTRLDFVNDRIKILAMDASSKRMKEANQPKPKEATKEPWNYPGPIAPIGMKPVLHDDGTYTHVTNTEPEYQTDEATAADYQRIVKWAAHLGIGPETVAAHWGATAGSTNGMMYTKERMTILQERIRHIASNGESTKGEKKKVGLFTKKTEAEAPPQGLSKDEAEANLRKHLDDKVNQVLDAALQQKREHAIEFFREGGDYVGEITTREQADEILRNRNLAILELSFITEQYEKAKQNLEFFIEKFSLAYDPFLEEFFLKNNPTGKKTWSLMYGDLKVANKPESVALDTERDPDESMFQAWLKTQFEKNKQVADQIGIGQKISYSRDLTKFKDWYKGHNKPPVVPGIKHTPARENVFSISPSLDTVKKNIREDLKEKGLR